jgi:integrase
MGNMKLFKITSGKSVYWALYNPAGEYQADIAAYLIHCVDDLALNEATVLGRAYALKSWAGYLLLNNTKLTKATNDTVRVYRDYLFENPKKNWSNDLKSRQRSINQYLKIIYDFYHWMQFNNSSAYFLGPSNFFNIYSTLTLNSKQSREVDKYPLLFKRTSSKSKHRTTYTPDYQTFLSLYRHFISSHSAPVAERNCLILKIALEAGFRVGSTASLTIDDFDKSQLRDDVDYFTVKPSVQKFGRSNSFDISINLAMSIFEYIDGPRKQLNTDLHSKSNHLFLNTITGSNLLSKSISSEFSRAAKQLGLPYRAGIHCWRGLYTENLIDYESDARRELGFDSSIESIGMVVSKALGHSNPLSQQNYIRSLKSKHKSSQAFRHMQEVAYMQKELLQTIKACEILRKEVEELTRNP